ncbi:zinc finger domain-containing protein [Streptomyces sp. YGL11-2]|uniref:zinc finger domain-containing protein n=1 Tax=Streptomyces sp. YGL11-2 TaxID=3414028 RepID=UPI003CE682DA
MQGDRRQIQTAVLGSADSDQPLVLPLEAIELDSFRWQHQHDTFWCGHLLGGCGGQLTTKLYTDRVCHFAHHPDPTGQPRICERRARDVSSADHLYLKAAAATWLADRGHKAAFTFPQPDGAAIGSVLDIAWDAGNGALRIHLDAAVPPAWDNHDVDVVLGMTVPVDDDTLVRRWYVHRVRFESAGTAREVRIGTQAFARGTEWFTLDECDMTERGLSTPAAERIIRARRTPPPRTNPPPRTTPTTPRQPIRGQDMLFRLAEARRSGSTRQAEEICRQIERSGLHQDHQQLATGLATARQWLEERRARQAKQRQNLFRDLQHATLNHKPPQVRALLTRVDATASDDRTKEEDAIADAAAAYLEDLKRTARWEHRDAAPPVRGPKFSKIPSRHTPRTAPAILRSQAKKKDPQAAAHRRMCDILHDLRRLGDRMTTAELQQTVTKLSKATAAAGNEVTDHQRQEVLDWVARADTVSQTSPRPVPPPRPETEQQHKGQGHDSQPRLRNRAEPQRPAAKRQPRSEKPKKSEPPRLPSNAVTEVAAAVTGELKKTAREHSTTSWSRLRTQLGSALPPLNPDDQLEVLLRVEILIRVRKQNPADEPLLSSLIAVNDTSNPQLYQQLLNRLGRDQAEPGWWQTEALRLHQIWRHR